MADLWDIQVAETSHYISESGVVHGNCGFDELTQFPREDQYEYLFSRIRRDNMDRDAMLATYGSSDDGLTIADIPLRMRGASNPGGPGMHWVKPRFVDPETRTAPFLPSTFLDNPGINAEEYRKTLAHLSEVERRRLELGDWDIVEVPGALWKFGDIHRVDVVPELDVVAVSVDGSVSDGTGDEAGIVIGGITRSGVGIVIEDASMRGHPDDWAKKAVLTYHDHGATRLVIEENQGGELNRSIVYNAADVLGLERPNVVLVRAKPNESKELRAQPVAQGYRAPHVIGDGDPLREEMLVDRNDPRKIMHGPLVRDSKLEAQMTSWIPGDKLSIESKSPDRVDALVWLLLHLLWKRGAGGRTESSSRVKEKMASWR